MYVNNWSKNISAKEQKIRSQNNLPLKAPACVHKNFLGLQMYLEPPVLDFKYFFSDSVVSLGRTPTIEQKSFEAHESCVV